MNNISTDELLLIAKAFACAMGDPSISLNDLDKEAAKYLIKKMAERRIDWTPAQKEQFKLLVEIIMHSM